MISIRWCVTAGLCVARSWPPPAETRHMAYYATGEKPWASRALGAGFCVSEAFSKRSSTNYRVSWLSAGCRSKKYHSTSRSRFSLLPGTGSRLPADGKRQPEGAASPDPQAICEVSTNWGRTYLIVAVQQVLEVNVTSFPWQQITRSDTGKTSTSAHP